jgi:hypothetical protein
MKNVSTKNPPAVPLRKRQLIQRALPPLPQFALRLMELRPRKADSYQPVLYARHD